MRFSVVGIGYDQHQVDSCLDDLDARLARLADRARAGAADPTQLDLIRQEADRLRDLLGTGSEAARPQALDDAEAEAEAIRARARTELMTAQEEARQLREQVYAEAVQARRDFEAALHARRQREARVDEVLRAVRLVPVDTPTAAAGAAGGVPATRGAATRSGRLPEEPADRNSSRMR
ncbi:ATPase [Micromonospora echinofusca]|uniref:ATPase n=1 Tax=Micromonospora echinofusca TaxID=47858 RepID=A0ABS3VW94_MICEH|nr:ATPase [Micromonospora echinofusca]MBO4208812.1 ATPase [Micromonospora echinofusca]